jgi:hypothetical protein
MSLDEAVDLVLFALICSRRARDGEKRQNR